MNTKHDIPLINSMKSRHHVGRRRRELKREQTTYYHISGRQKQTGEEPTCLCSMSSSRNARHCGNCRWMCSTSSLRCSLFRLRWWMTLCKISVCVHVMWHTCNERYSRLEFGQILHQHCERKKLHIFRHFEKKMSKISIQMINFPSILQRFPPKAKFPGNSTPFDE